MKQAQTRPEITRSSTVAEHRQRSRVPGAYDGSPALRPRRRPGLVLLGAYGGLPPTYPEAAILELVGLIYDAAGNPASWRAFPNRLQQIAKAPATNLDVEDTETCDGNVLINLGIDPGNEQTYLAELIRVPLNSPAALKRRTPQTLDTM